MTREEFYIWMRKIGEVESGAKIIGYGERVRVKIRDRVRWVDAMRA